MSLLFNFIWLTENRMPCVNSSISVTADPCYGMFHTNLIQWNLYSSFSLGVWKRNNGSGKTIDAGAIVEIGFAQGPQKLNDRSGKTNYLGTIDRGFTVYIKKSRPCHLQKTIYKTPFILVRSENLHSTAKAWCLLR
jgi:hypothetical protein